MSADEQRQRQDKSFVIHADAPDRPTRLVVQDVDAGESTVGSPARVLTPPSHYVDEPLVVARRTRDRLRRGADDRFLGAVRDAHLRRRRPAAATPRTDRRSRRA